MEHEDDLPALLARVASGDRAALRAIYVRQSTRLFGIAMAILRNRSEASDAMQDAFVKIMGRAGQFDAERGRAEVWIDSVVRHSALDMARRRGREVLSDDPELGDTAVPAEAFEVLAQAQDGARLRACLGRLEAKNRDTIILAFVHGLSHPEIAARQGLPIGTVKSWIRRGLISLRECLS